MNIYIDIREGKRVFDVAAGTGNGGIEKLALNADLHLRVYFVQKRDTTSADGQQWEAVYKHADDPATMPKLKRALVHYPEDGSAREELLPQPSPVVDPSVDPARALDETFPFEIKIIRYDGEIVEGAELTALLGEKRSVPAVLELTYQDQDTSITVPIRIDCVIENNQIS